MSRENGNRRFYGHNNRHSITTRLTLNTDLDVLNVDIGNMITLTLPPGRVLEWDISGVRVVRWQKEGMTVLSWQSVI